MDSEVGQLLSGANILANTFQQGGGIVYIDKAIVLDREALKLYQPSRPERSNVMGTLACHLYYRYTRLGGMDDLNEAITLGRDALALRQPGDDDRVALLGNLGIHLAARYDQLGEIGDLEEAIVLGQEALSFSPPGHPGRLASLSSLASYLSTRYNYGSGGMDDLNEAIVLERDALALRPPDDARRPSSLSDLSHYLSKRYAKLGEINDLNEAVALSRESLALCPPHHPYRPTFLNVLSSHLSIRYKQLGSNDDLDQAIVLSRESLALLPPGHPGRPSSLNNLALHLWTRYSQLRGTDDLDEAILLSREALTSRPPGHPGRATSLNNLALHLLTRYKQLKKVDDLDEAIVFAQESLALCTSGHAERSASLNNLAALFSSRYDQFGRMKDLDEAISLAREALELHPPGHSNRLTTLNNFAHHLFLRHGRLGRPDDLDEAIVYGREALLLYPLGHPVRSNPLNNLVEYLYVRFTRVGREDVKEELFNLYAQMEDVSDIVSSYDLTAAKSWVDAAEGFRHSTILRAYKTALRLLVQHLTALPPLPHHLPLFKDVASTLAADAFSACLRNHAFSDAIELLEQGRAVFWSQLNRLRSPLDDIAASGPAGKTLADEFMHLTLHIRTALDSTGVDQHDRVWHLNLELRRVVSKIRELPGFSQFLLPPSFTDLQRAASDGPVIIVNASKYGCDALVVFADRDPVHIPLPISKDATRQLSSNLHTLTMLGRSVDVTRDLGVFLRKLWDNIVSHIVDFLLTAHPPRSRIWWCPTGEFALLPLHAAGPYRKGQQNLSALYISSYTPTLTALIRARHPGSPQTVTQKKHFVAIGQAAALGANELPSVSTELANIGQLIDGLALFTRIEGPDSCIPRVAEELGKNDWVHFACHGFPNRKAPFESAFALADGLFTIQHIIRSSLQNPEFAYLSACHTTVGDDERPDEMIHLASAMQFAGFRSVIGTMWSVDDAETAKITTMFYKLMVDESGYLDHTRAAFALWKTMRSVNIPLDQRILYVHLGA